MIDKEKLQEKIRKEQQIKVKINRILEPKAYERLMNVRLSNEKLYFSTVALLLQNINEIKKRLKEDEIIEILQSLRSNYEPKFEIKR
ncbi:DNA-binding protein [Candidatus Micrarchaeota archaeon]|jgi:DNA-binding TFAR19-related protein (PDSD5 family)|nr:DNA-binding protein [Candidatus Micrarchaeota archaeon]